MNAKFFYLFLFLGKTVDFQEFKVNFGQGNSFVVLFCCIHECLYVLWLSSGQIPVNYDDTSV